MYCLNTKSFLLYLFQILNKHLLVKIAFKKQTYYTDFLLKIQNSLGVFFMSKIASDSSPSFTPSYLDDYKILSSVNDVFAFLDEDKQITNDLNFDLSLLENDLFNNLANPDREKTLDINARLAVWRQILEKFDIGSSVAKLRHYFEEIGNPTALTLEHLLVFYLTKQDKSSQETDKIDLIVTRLGRLAFQTSESKKILLSEPELKNHLEKLFLSFQIPIIPESELKDEITLIENERKILLSIRSLREMLEKQALIKLRKIKVDLGQKFFQPLVLAEIVALNTCLHNVFQDLFLAEQPKLAHFLNQSGSSIQRITSIEQALATVIERADKPSSPTEHSDDQISVNRAEVMEIINGMRDVLMSLDKHLQMLSEKLDT